MRPIDRALLLVVAALMLAIAFELHQLNRAVADVAALSRGVTPLFVHPAETRAERTDRLQRQQRQVEEDWRAILDTPRTPTHK